jgi:hypothetical protein
MAAQQVLFHASCRQHGGMGGGLQGTIVRIQRRGSQIGVGGNNRAQYAVLCNSEVCVMATYQTTFGGVGPAS